MDTTASNDPSDQDLEGVTQDAKRDEQSEAMKNQLQNDVMSWKAARNDGPGRGTAIAAPLAKPPARKPPAKSGAAAPVRQAAQPADDKKKPFGMSYDGMSQADYITYMMARGRR